VDANEHYAAGEKALKTAGQSPPMSVEGEYYARVAQAHFLAAITARLTDLVGAVEPIRVTLQQSRGLR
jgi:hypothetical protein